MLMASAFHPDGFVRAISRMMFGDRRERDNPTPFDRAQLAAEW